MENRTTVVFEGNGNIVSNIQNVTENGQLNESQKETLEYIRTHEGCNTTMISNGLGKPFRTIDKHIQFMIATKIIERRGSKKTGGYYIV